MLFNLKFKHVTAVSFNKPGLDYANKIILALPLFSLTSSFE